MGLMDYTFISSHIRVDIKNETTGKIRTYEYQNKLTNDFLNRIAQWIAGINNTGANSIQYPTKFQLGTGSGTPANGDTDLFTPVSGSLISITARSVSTNVTTLIINYPSNYITGTFTEAGLKDDAFKLLTHFMLSPSVQITANESVQFTYTLTING